MSGLRMPAASSKLAMPLPGELLPASSTERSAFCNSSRERFPEEADFEEPDVEEADIQEADFEEARFAELCEALSPLRLLLRLLALFGFGVIVTFVKSAQGRN